jgi:uncharacterized damage-inducible protein DinB
MNTSAAALKAQFDLHTRLFNNVLAGITDSDANTRKNDNINHIKWVAGHLLNARVTNIAQMTGGQPDSTYTAQFGRGAFVDANDTYPPLAEITGKWNDTAAAFSNGISHIPEEVLAAPSPAKTPVADDTIRGLLSFLLSHEAYHIGQLSILRKMAGKEAMAYN